jgi:POT family proton-dependent oligopeptide transporter
VIAAVAMAIGAILQWKVYTTSPCGYYATDCEAGLSTVSLWAQMYVSAWLQLPQVSPSCRSQTHALRLCSPLYALPAIAELFIYTTSYEMAYSQLSFFSFFTVRSPYA